MPSSSLPRRADIILLVLVAAFVYLHVFRPMFTPVFYEGDHLIFLYDADRMFRGDVMYRDFFQFTFPGNQLLYLFLFGLFGPKYFVVGLVVIGIGVALYWTGLAISRQVIDGPLAYLPPVIFIFWGMRWFGMEGAHRMLSPIFMLLAVWTLVRGTSIRSAALAGIFCSLASFITQPRGVYTLAACCIFLSADFLAGRDRLASMLYKQASAAACFFITLAVLCGYFIYTAGPETFFDSTVIYPMKHYALHPENTASKYLRDLGQVFEISSPNQILRTAAAVLYAVLLPLAGPAFFIGAAIYRNRHTWDHFRKPFFLAVAATLSYIGIAGPAHIRFFSVSMPAIILLVWMLSQTAVVKRFQDAFAFRFVPALIVLAFLMALSSQIRIDHTNVEMPVGTVAIAQPATVDERYVWLRDRTSPSDYFYELSEQYMYFPLQLRNATRIGQIFPNGYTPRQHVLEVIEELSKNRPRFILLDRSIMIPDDQRVAGDSTSPLAAYIAQKYRPVDPNNVANAQIWELLPDAGVE